MEFGKAFSFQFQDPDWVKKLLIAAAIMLIPVIGQITVAGWAFEVTRRVIRQDPTPLPDWSEFGNHLIKGLLLSVINLVYALPILIIGGCPIAIVAIANPDNSNIITIVSSCVGCIFAIYILLMMFLVPAAIGNYAATDQFGSAFRLKEVFGLVRAAPTAYLLVLLGSLVASIIASAGSIVCVIGVVATGAYALTITGHMQGQAHNAAKANQGLQPANPV